VNQRGKKVSDQTRDSLPTANIVNNAVGDGGGRKVTVKGGNLRESTERA